MGIEKLLKWKLWNKKYTKKVSVNISRKRIYFWTKNDWIVRSIESVETLMYDKVAHFLDIFFDLNTIQFYAVRIIYSRLKLYLEILWVIINISHDSFWFFSRCIDCLDNILRYYYRDILHHISVYFILHVLNWKCLVL